jgi:hypothetical protein
MPNIKTFDTPQLGLRPSEIGVEATAAAARRIGAFSNQRGEALTNVGARLGRAGAAAADAVDDHITHMEVQAGAKHGSEGLLNLDNEWNTTTAGGKNADGTIRPPADPNDPSVAGKFMSETFELWADQFRSGFTTKKGEQYADQFINRARNHFQVKTAADMAGLAKQATTENLKGLGNNLANMAFKDPTSLESAWNILDHSTNAIVGTSGIPGAHKVEVANQILDDQRKALVQATVTGLIRNGGDWHKIVDDPKYGRYISAPEVEKFDKAAKTEARRDEIDAKNARILDQQNTDRQAGEQINSIINNITYDDSDQPNIPKGTVKALADVLRNNPTVSERVRKDIQGEIARVGKTQGQVIKSDNETVKADLNTRMMDPNNPTTRLQILEAQDKLTPRTFRQLEAIQKEVETGHLHDPAWKVVMNDSMKILGTDPIGAQKHGAWAPEFMRQYLAAKRAGTLEPNALSLDNKDSMISKSLESYKRTPMQMMVDKVSHGIPVDIEGAKTILQGGGEIGGVKPSEVRVGGQTVIPPATQREVGKTYTTPAGPRIWRGDGWEKPK